MEEQEKYVDFVHPELNQEHSTIAGYYFILKEDRFSLKNREVLYLIGSGVYDNACCGGGNCSYALVPGLIVDWEYKKNNEGRSISRVEPVKDENLRKEISRIMKEQETVSQVIFN